MTIITQAIHPPSIDPAEIAHAVNIIVGDGVCEARALEALLPGDRFPGTYSGYFDDIGRLVDAVARFRQARGIYITMNAVSPAVLARANNRLRRAGRGTTTSDADVTGRRWLLLDIDPVRPAGVSATDAEREAAMQRAAAIRDALRAEGWPDPIEADSGNGMHLLYRINLPADDGQLVRRCLAVLAARFDDDAVRIDQGVHNAARIVRLYGTIAAKGDPTPDRPHRMSRLLRVPDELRPVPRVLLEALARQGEPTTPSPRLAGDVAGHAFDVQKFLDEHGIEADGPHPWNGGRRWILPVCPWNSEHNDRSAHIEQHASGAISAGCHHNGCVGRGWPDLRAMFDPDYHGRAHGDHIHGAQVAATLLTANRPATGDTPPGRDAVEVVPLPSGLPPVQAYQSDMLPEALRDFVDDVAERMQCPPDFVAAPLVVVLGTVIGRRCGLRPKRRDDWTVVPNLWGMVIGRPSLMKSPAIARPLSLLHHLERQAREQFNAAEVLYEQQKLLADAQQAQLKRELKEAIADGAPTDHILARMAAVQVSAPKRVRYVTNDATVEKLGELLADNPNGVMVCRDELSGWLYSLERDNQQGAREFYLEAWSGTGRFTYDRIGRGTVDIESAVVSIFGTIQPGKLSAYVRSTLSGGVGNDGLLPRFQLMVWPDPPAKWRNVDRWPDSRAEGRARNLVQQLTQVTLSSLDAAQDEPDGVPYLRFDDDAQMVFDQWREALENRLRAQDHPVIEEHLSKFRSLIPSLALIFHLADLGRGPVGVPALTLAIRWGDYLESHARRVYSAATVPEISAAKSIWRRLEAGDLPERFTCRDVYRRCWAGLTDRETVKVAVELLEDHGFIIPEPQPRSSRSAGGRVTTVYSVNPAAKVTDKTDKTSSVSFVSTPSNIFPVSAGGGER